jgi:hypothetical protein
MLQRFLRRIRPGMEAIHSFGLSHFDVISYRGHHQGLLFFLSLFFCVIQEQISNAYQYAMVEGE